MNDDTDTMKIPELAVLSPASQQPQPAKPAPKKPGNTLLIVGTALVAIAAAKLFAWADDPELTHAQSAVISAVVLIVIAGTALIGHGVRVWIHAAETRIAALITAAGERTATDITGVGKRSRVLFYGLSRDLTELGETVGALSAEYAGEKSLIGDFIKRYPPAAQMDDLAETVRSVGRVVIGLAQQRDPVEQEAEWFTEAVALGRRLEAEDRRRQDNGGTATV